LNFNTQLTENFNLSEFFKNVISFNSSSDIVLSNIQKLALKLQLFRSYKNKSISISSSFRTRSENYLSGGKVHSYHLEGLAADIYYKDIEKTFLKDYYALKFLFSGVIYYPDMKFFHCDIGSRVDRPFYNLKSGN